MCIHVLCECASTYYLVSTPQSKRWLLQLSRYFPTREMEQTVTAPRPKLKKQVSNRHQHCSCWDETKCPISRSILAIIAATNTDKKPLLNGIASPSHLVATINTNPGSKPSKCHSYSVMFFFCLQLTCINSPLIFLPFSCGGIFEDGWQDAFSQRETGGEGQKPW